MFGSQEGGLIHEGTVRYQDGSFEIVSSFRGERHILIIGKDKDPLKSIGVNLTVGRKNDLGEIDLSEVCPK